MTPEGKRQERCKHFQLLKTTVSCSSRSTGPWSGYKSTRRLNGAGADFLEEVADSIFLNI